MTPFPQTPLELQPPFQYQHDLGSVPADLDDTCPCLSGHTAGVCYFLDAFSPLALDVLVRAPRRAIQTGCSRMRMVSLWFMAAYTACVFLSLTSSGLVGVAVRQLPLAVITVQVVFYCWHGGLLSRPRVRLRRDVTSRGPRLVVRPFRPCCSMGSLSPHALDLKGIEGPVVAAAKQINPALAEQALARWTQVLLLRGGAP